MSVPALIRRIAERVDGWRGFALGPAAAAWEAEGRYEPTSSEEFPVSDTTIQLLQHWFRSLPHEVPAAQGFELFRYWPHQRRFIETVIYLHEVRKLRGVDDLWDAFEVPRDFVSYDPWPKLGGQLATGSGKTKIMSLLIAWSTLNALREGPSHLGLGPQVLVVAPGLFVKERLLFDFFPGDRASVFRADPVIPPTLAGDWHLPVYGPETCPQRLDPQAPALIVTNIHQLHRMEEPPAEVPTTGKQIWLALEAPTPKKLEEETTPLMSRFRRGAGVLVINDEAHHVGDEPAHQRFEKAAQNKKSAGLDASEEMAWIRSLRGLNERAGLGLQVDLSATLYEEEGGARTAKSKKGIGPKPFRHTVLDYPLRQAIEDGVVKHPVLEKVEVSGAEGEADDEGLVRENQPNAWLKYEPLLRAGIGRWVKVRDQLRAEGDPRKPILFLLCADRTEAQEVANFLTWGDASAGNLSSYGSPTGFVEPESGERLFVEEVGGELRSTVIQIHIGEKEEKNEAEWQKVREAVNAVDHDAIPDRAGGVDEEGRPLMLPNPYNVVISVMMLKEGWDVRNVKVIVPLRTCDSRTLTEQVLGRGLRRMHPALMAEDGAMSSLREELYVMQHPSFDAIIDEIKDVLERKTSDEIDHPPEYVRIEPREDEAERFAHDVRFVNFLGVREQAEDWRADVKVQAGLKLPWQEEFHDQQVQTWLHGALDEADAEGQQFTLAAVPTFRTYLDLLDVVYVEPLLRDIQASFDHKLALRTVVKEHLERRTFKLPMGLPLSFDRAIEAGPESGRIAVFNLARPEVIGQVRDALRGPVRDAIQGRHTERVADLRELRGAGLRAYAARKEHELPKTGRSVFANAALENETELRFAALVDRCPDVVGWLYNHRQGVGIRIEYDWMGHLAWYYPDFIVRVKWGERHHNLIIEVKGRMDARDEAKEKVGNRYAAVLAEHDPEPWHYLLVREDAKVDQLDLSWWEDLAHPTMGKLLAHLEGTDEDSLLTRRLLTREGLTRHVVRLASSNGGVTFDELKRRAEGGEADVDTLLLTAEGLVNRAHRLDRLFIERATGRVLPQDEVSRLFKDRTAAGKVAREAVDVVYRPEEGGR